VVIFEARKWVVTHGITDLLGQLFVAKDLQSGMECETSSVKFFKKCGISNAPDGTKDDVSFKKVVVETETLRMMMILGDSATG